MRGFHKTVKSKEKRKRGSHGWLSLISIVLLASFCYSAYKLTDGLIAAKKERDAFEELFEIVTKNTPAPGSENAQSMVPVDAGNGPDKADGESSERSGGKAPLQQYIPLYEMNPDFFGWLSVEGTDMDFPVMYSSDRPEYYLNHAFDGSSSSSGVPFIDGRCSPEGSYLLIYGHHMKNKTMFGQLPKYADREYYEEHPVIRFDTLYEQGEYQVVAAFYSRVYGRNETGVFRYYEYYDLSEKEVFEEYMREVRTAAIYETGIEAAYGDELLVLSTCNFHTDNGRFVVVARKIDNRADTDLER